MKNISFAFFAILIAIVLFATVKNIFFNKNQFSKRIKHKFFAIVLGYFAVCGLGVYLLIIFDVSKKLTLINLDIVFFAMTLSVIFTIFRMEQNYVSIYDKWFYSARFKNERYYEVTGEARGMGFFYTFNILIALAPATWTVVWKIFNYESLTSINLIYYITFLSLALVFVVATILINATALGRLVKQNLIYNYLCEKVQQDNPQNIAKIGEIKADMIELFGELFVRGRNPNDEDKNKQILNWIYNLTNDGQTDKPMTIR